MDTKNITGTTYPKFSDSIPRHYDQYLGPMFFEPYAIDIAKRINPSSIQLAFELGCGTGRATYHLYKNLPVTAKLVASDVSEDMLALARRN
jgi:ubiquinone/menaquinone biosynthesis C-methylase UbiE